METQARPAIPPRANYHYDDPQLQRQPRGNRRSHHAYAEQAHGSRGGTAATTTTTTTATQDPSAKRPEQLPPSHGPAFIPSPVDIAAAPVVPAASSPSFITHLQQKQQQQQQQQEQEVAVEQYPESLTRSVSTRSSSRGSHPNSNNGSPTHHRTSLRSPDVFDTAVYDPTSDSIHIMPHSRQNSLDAQFQDFKDRIYHGKSQQVKLLSLARPQSLTLPLRARDSCRELRSSSALNQEVTQVPMRTCSVSSRRATTKSFDLMAPPAGKRRSCMTYTQDGPAETLIKPSDTVDADPSDALTSQIASSILRERYGVNSAEAVPLKVQEAVRTCLRDVSATVEHDHPQWGLPVYRSSSAAAKATRNGSSGRSRKSNNNSNALKSRKRGTEPAEDPFQHDICSRENKDGRGGDENHHCNVSRGPTLKKKARLQQDHNIDEIPTDSEFPCPYRRRNPILFNIREHEHCARRAFSTMAELKRHVRTHHRKGKAPYQCPRCRSGFTSEDALSNHLTVPLKEMCEPPTFAPGTSPDEGITEEMDRILADKSAQSKVQTWEEIWRLLFGPDTAVLEPEFLPIVEVVEAEQEFDECADDLKHDLCDRLRQLLPDHAGDVVFFQVLAGQVQLVVEQHRAKVNRHCRQNATLPARMRATVHAGTTNGATAGTETTIKQHRSTSSRFSLSAAAHHASQSSNNNNLHRFSSSLSRRSPSNGMIQPLRTNSTSPATAVTTSSSVYSNIHINNRRSSLHSSTSTSSSSSSSSSSGRPQTRSSGVSSIFNNNNDGTTSNNKNILARTSSMIQVESPRLPFRDWVQGIKMNNGSETPSASVSTPPSNEASAGTPGQRDSGLALQCDLCCTEPCQCGGGGSYADQLSAFMTPAPAQSGNFAGNAGQQQADWAAHYGGSGMLSAGGLLTTAPSQH